MTYSCPQCGLPRTGNQAMGLAMPQCLCSWQFSPPTPPAPKREWQGLTDEEKSEIYHNQKFVVGFYSPAKFADAIEAKLKEKNT